MYSIIEIVLITMGQKIFKELDELSLYPKKVLSTHTHTHTGQANNI